MSLLEVYEGLRKGISLPLLRPFLHLIILSIFMFQTQSLEKATSSSIPIIIRPHRCTTVDVLYTSL